jgi:hypothetical protein
MKKTHLLLAVWFIAVTTMAGNEMGPLMVRHVSPQGKPLETAPFPYTWYYRTEVENVSDRPLRIVWFQAFMFYGEGWYPGNAKGQTLRGADFSEWYTEGASVKNGLILPGQTAVCDVNWHGSEEPEMPRLKWEYIATDETGRDVHVVAEVDPGVVRMVESKNPDKP